MCGFLLKDSPLLIVSATNRSSDKRRVSPVEGLGFHFSVPYTLTRLAASKPKTQHADPETLNPQASNLKPINPETP